MSANQESASTTPGPGQGRTSAGCLPVGEGCGTPNGAAACRVVYFSSVSQNTKRFVDSLGFDAIRLPLYERREPMPVMDGPYVLIVPTYGGGSPKGAVPKQVIHFLNIPVNRSWIRGSSARATGISVRPSARRALSSRKNAESPSCTGSSSWEPGRTGPPCVRF